MQQPDLAWSVPVMRAGYAGRGLVYLVVAGFSLYAIWQGGEAQGTSSALSQLQTSAGGGLVLWLIFFGLAAFAIWCVIDALYDLEDHGTEAKGIAARFGLVCSGLFNLAIGGLALSVFLTGGQPAGDSSTASGIASVMDWPGGRWLVGLVGLAVVGGGIYFILKGWRETYRRHLQANRFTIDWNWLLKAGVMARGVVIGVVGILFIQTAWRADPQQAGGIGKAFGWLTDQPYGRILVAVLCVGLLGFALFSFVNAVWRIVPKVPDDKVETLAVRLAAKAREAASQAGRSRAPGTS